VGDDERMGREGGDHGSDVGREWVDEANLGRECDDLGSRCIQRHVLW
jgi:hypothetical protein